MFTEINITSVEEPRVKKKYPPSWLLCYIYCGKYDTLQQILHVNDIIILQGIWGFGITSNSVSVVTGSIDNDQKSMQCDNKGGGGGGGGISKSTYELINLTVLKISKWHKNRICQCMDKTFCVDFQRYPLKFHTIYLTRTLKGSLWKFESSKI